MAQEQKQSEDDAIGPTNVQLSKEYEILASKNLFRCQITSDIDILELLHEKIAWIPGKNNIRPKIQQKKDKIDKINNEQMKYLSGKDYIFHTVFGCQTNVNANGLLFVHNKDNLNKEIFMENRFPYDLPPKTLHYIMWYSKFDTQNIDQEKINNDINNNIKEILKGEKNKQNGYDFVWYKNPKMTVNDVFHVQVFWIKDKSDV